MSRTQKIALRWFADLVKPIGWFGYDAPTQKMRNILLRNGLIERVLPENGIGLVRFQISRAGKDALL